MDNSNSFQEIVPSILIDDIYLDYPYDLIEIPELSDLSPIELNVYKYDSIEYLNNHSENKTEEYTNKKKRREKIKNNSKETHSKNAIDNIIQKICNNFKKFLIDLANEYLRNLKIKERFYNISGKFNSDKNLQYLNWLINQTLKTFLELECSGKCKNHNKNKELMSTIDYEKHKRFFDLKYEEIYNQYYYKNNRKKFEEIFNLKLSSKIKMNKSFLNYIKKKYPSDHEYHKKVMEYSKNFINYIKTTPWKKKSIDKNFAQLITEL